MKRILTLVVLTSFLFIACEKYDGIKPVANDSYVQVGKGVTLKLEFTQNGLVLNAQQPGISDYYWKCLRNNYIISNPDTPVISIIDTGTFIVFFGQHQDSSIIHVYPKVTCFYPNSFRPDSYSNKNKLWSISIMGITSFDLKIYNTDFILLFQTNNSAEGWDGTFNGKDCPLGWYYFFAEYTSFVGQHYTKSGYIQLLR